MFLIRVLAYPSSMTSLYFEFLIPFLISAVVVIVITIIAERYGTRTGGILGTLPSTMVIAFLFIAYNEGINHASQAVAVVAAEMGVNLMFLLVFSLLAHRSLRFAIPLAFVVWTILSFLLYYFNVDNIFLSLSIYILAFMVSFGILEKIKKIPSSGVAPVQYTPLKIAFRGVLAGIVIALAVYLSNIGAVLSGIFSAFPAIFLSTMIISTKEHGSSFSGALAKSMIFGSPSVVSYAVAIYFFYPLSGILIGTFAAFLIACGVTLLLFVFAKHLR
jgi:uncharacterized membrane protein (GlpM family)